MPDLSIFKTKIKIFHLKTTLHTLRLLIFLLGFSFQLMPVTGQSFQSEARFIENKGQWPVQVKFKLKMNTGSVYFEENGLRFDIIHPKDLNHLNRHRLVGETHVPETLVNDSFSAFNFFVSFNDALQNPIISGEKQLPGTYNYFHGNDPDKWAANTHAYRKMVYQNLYEGIDFRYFEENGHLKYDILIQPGTNPADIQMQYHDITQLVLKNKTTLIIGNPVNEIAEMIPMAYQLKKGKKKKVKCHYNLNGNIVSFVFPDGYDNTRPLVIDPVLVFSTYSGSSADNFGFTATNDKEDGHLYAGGIVFSNGYPVTPGAYKGSFSGAIDLGITKFSKDGSSLVYSTYIGGNNSETPNSLVVNDNDELYILGVTGSANFPVSANAYQGTFNGGTFVSFPSNGATFTQGTDVYIFKLDSTGSKMLASTFIGGTGNDGLNDGPLTTPGTVLNFNYGDQFRGEIIVDDQDNIFVASSTRSADFPTTSGVLQSVLGGSKDGVVFMMNGQLSSLTWSTFLGGSDEDAAYSVKLDSRGDLYVCGGTGSQNFPTTNNVVSPFPRGAEDGFLVKIETSITSLIAGTYIGTTGYDQVYFVEVDQDDNPYVVGQTDGNYPVTPGVYSNPNSGQFITKFDDALSTVQFSTVFGKGDGDPELSPTAFLVDRCNNIYFSGWGGTTNQFSNNPDWDIKGLPRTQDAFQKITDGSDFYFFVLSENADSLLYASYFGGATSAEHVDGGTSRFDKNGIIYQAVCAGCGGNSDFPTTPNAWSKINKSSNCNIGILKFEFELQKLKSFAAVVNNQEGCIPLTVEFENKGSQNASYLWIFGDGTTSNLENPVKVYDSASIYKVLLIVFDTSRVCMLPDTAFVTIKAYAFALADFTYEPKVVKFGEPVQFTNHSQGASNYIWDFGDGDQSNDKDPEHTFATPGVYEVCLVVFSNEDCNDTICKQIIIPIADVPNAFSPNGDGKNEILFVKGFGVETLIFRVYNRWGQLVFETNDLNKGWNGEYKGVAQEQDVYVFELDVVFENKETFKKKGNITLIR
jgi:gliding motility-associated-like protein